MEVVAVQPRLAALPLHAALLRTRPSLAVFLADPLGITYHVADAGLDLGEVFAGYLLNYARTPGELSAMSGRWRGTCGRAGGWCRP